MHGEPKLHYLYRTCQNLMGKPLGGELCYSFTEPLQVSEEEIFRVSQPLSRNTDFNILYPHNQAILSCLCFWITTGIKFFCWE